MKIKLGTLRRIIRETVEQELSSSALDDSTYALLQNSGFGPTLGRMSGSIRDALIRTRGGAVQVTDLQKQIADFGLTKNDIMNRKPELQEALADITGESVATYLIDKVTKEWLSSPQKTPEVGRHDPKPNLGGGFYSGD